jgi:hypothetical protein
MGITPIDRMDIMGITPIDRMDITPIDPLDLAGARPFDARDRGHVGGVTLPDRAGSFAIKMRS